MIEKNAALRPLVRPILFLVAFTFIPQFELRPFWAAAFVTVLWSYRFWLDLRNATMPPRWVRMLMQVTAAAAVWVHFHSFFGDEAGGTFLTLLLALKVFELRRKRDFFVTCILCLLVVMSYLLLEQGLMITFFLIADVVLVITFMLALEAEKWSWTSWRPFLGPGLGLTMKALPLLVLTFLLFPRFSTGFGTGANSAGRMGVSDSLRPGSVGRLMTSDELVFRATFLHGEVPPQNQLYWRGVVLDTPDDLNWSRSRDQDLGRHAPQADQPSVEVFLEPSTDRFLYSLDTTQSLGFPSDVQGRRVRLREGRIFEMTEPLQTRERYLIESGVVPSEDPPTPRMLKVNGTESREMQAFLHRFEGLSRGDAVSALMQHFRNDGYVYSLQPPPSPTIDQFLFRTKEGFCEHYAGAMATILRRLHIPSRVVLGYQGGTRSILGNYISVRAHDAHAWVEYYDANDNRWRRVDPTAQVAPVRLSQGSETFLQEDQNLQSRWLPSEWLRTKYGARAVFDQVEGMWTRFLIGFDLGWQRDMLSKIGMDEALFRALPVFLILSLALIFAVLYFFEAQRREPLSTDEKLYRRLQKILSARGIVRAPFEGPLALLEKVRGKDARLASVVEPVLMPLVRVRFGREPLTRELIQQIRAGLRQIKRQSKE